MTLVVASLRILPCLHFIA